MFHGKQINDILQKNRLQLVRYLELLERWQHAVNLVSKSTLPEAWQRHIVDSAQLFPLLPDGVKTITDMGSGAGFPGMVLAILTQAEMDKPPVVTLVESDTKKCLFLKEVARQLNISVTILNQRLEMCEKRPTDVITARALASLDCLLGWAKPFLTSASTCLFLKGEEVEMEISAIQQKAVIERIQSLTHPRGCILKITEVKS